LFCCFICSRFSSFFRSSGSKTSLTLILTLPLSLFNLIISPLLLLNFSLSLLIFPSSLLFLVLESFSNKVNRPEPAFAEFLVVVEGVSGGVLVVVIVPLLLSEVAAEAVEEI